MALARSLAVAVVGIEGHLVEVEADLANGLPGLTLIGLPDAALHEARDRVRAAVVNSRERWPDRRITVGLFPATLPKSGSAFDLAMAAAILGAAGAVPRAALAGRILIGELALDGRLRPVRGVLPAVLAAVGAGLERIVVPASNAREAALVPGAVIEPMHDLAGVLDLLRGRPRLDQVLPEAAPAARPDPSELDLSDVAGQARGRLAAEVAAAGGHHLYLQGPPGTGKTMIAERLPGLLPALDTAAALEVTAVHSVAGVLPVGEPLVTRPPFRSPHHSATPAALVGSGSSIIRPGLASQAHHGVLFLDEAPEFGRSALDALRQPLESGQVEIARARATTRFPARFLLVLAANPCPCSRARGPRDLRCDCPSTARRRYLARLSGPLLDRIDIQIALTSPSRAELRADRDLAGSSAAAAQRVHQARRVMERRFAGTPWRRNAEVPGPSLRRRWPLRSEATRLADRAFERGLLTARGLDRVFRVAWTIADLNGQERPGPEEVGLALDLRLPGGRHE
ncbi:Mg chelatase-like protein [Parafrankia colletiae]|uniref:Mg chelatase-like protein n=1 Tax=Parafrankia colletiae TaxID=573497 RepID=A0A1S1RB28_9ACTN|nr:YifB family Mg chelatase-like AAA ATPase [Parafrankia colletiae]MCK9901070.1 YifB family Mg chelatase-like AAA ATPase [Frankia sp. Cpl3]OHV44048.1 Mg chelatase-like protein [Parafrankia colletiae]